MLKHSDWNNLPAETGTLVINPSVTNMLYVTAELNWVSIWNAVDIETKVIIQLLMEKIWQERT